MMFRTIALLAALLLPALSARAEEKVTPVSGIALHGAPKYGPDFKHFDYVNPEAPKGGTLRLAGEGTFDNLNPYIVKGIAADGAGLMYESLMEQSYDEPFTMYARLAESIEISENHTWVAFNINPKARWADGKPVTAEDVAWSFEALVEKGSPFFRIAYADVGKVDAVSTTRIKFTLKNSENTELPLILGQLPVLPKHYWEASGRNFGSTTLEPPLGSGPYKIGKVNFGHSIEYIRDPNWWGADLPVNKGKWNFDRVTYDYYKDANVIIEAFLAGQYDVREERVARLWATAYDVPPVRDGRITKQDIPNKQPQGIQAFVYNIRKPVFKDRAVREALAYAFDFEWSNKQLAFGAYKRSRSYFSNSELEATGLPEGRELEILQKFKGRVPDEVFTMEYFPPKTDGSGNNREQLLKAREILDKTGYKMGEDGIRVNADGERLSFEILSNDDAFERWTLPLKKNLQKLGVEAKLRTIDPTQYQNRLNSFDYDMIVNVWGESNSPGNEQREFWGSAKANAPGSRNLIGVQDPVVDELIDLLIHAKSREDLVACTHALDRVLQWGFYVIPQYHINYWRLAWWKGIEKPGQLSPLSPLIAETWWHTPEKK
jgi:microcin C transport system substrate-binding protein